MLAGVGAAFRENGSQGVGGGGGGAAFREKGSQGFGRGGGCIKGEWQPCKGCWQGWWLHFSGRMAAMGVSIGERLHSGSRAVRVLGGMKGLHRDRNSRVLVKMRGPVFRENGSHAGCWRG